MSENAIDVVIVVAGVVMFLILILSYLHQVTYRLGVRHGMQRSALDLRHAREEAEEIRSREELHRRGSDMWRSFAMRWMDIARRSRGHSRNEDLDGEGEVDGDDGTSPSPIRASATMIGLLIANGNGDHAAAAAEKIEELSAMCALGLGTPN